MLYCFCLFFFFKQKTAYEMRISDWSSDVCSSDLQRDTPGASVWEIDAGPGGPRPGCARCPVACELVGEPDSGPNRSVDVREVLDVRGSGGVPPASAQRLVAAVRDGEHQPALGKIGRAHV